MVIYALKKTSIILSQGMRFNYGSFWNGNKLRFGSFLVIVSECVGRIFVGFIFWLEMRVRSLGLATHAGNNCSRSFPPDPFVNCDSLFLRISAEWSFSFPRISSTSSDFYWLSRGTRKVSSPFSPPPVDFIPSCGHYDDLHPIHLTFDC